MAQNGQADLDRAEAIVTPIAKKMSGRDRKAMASISGRVDALIETARAHNRIASLKTEIVQLQAQSSARLAAAERNSAAAQIAATQAQSVAQASVAQAQASAAEAAALRGALRDYQMKQTALGATLVMSDVSFSTGKGDLKPGAVERLRPLATYLQANPEVRVHVDGHTDSEGSASANMALSETRAQAVRAGLENLGVSSGRIDTQGHGEDIPVADNQTASGRQNNRRVEITLVGQQATAFSGL
jgi:outer membrane protein OmpA-like peptidoglycan-associated protein